MNCDILHDTDGYKLCHPALWKPSAKLTSWYFECRSNLHFGETLFFGLQYALAGLVGVLREEDLFAAAADRAGCGVDFPYEAWLALLKETEGRIPLKIRAVPEGSIVPTGNVLFTVENTNPIGNWMGGWVETALVRAWYMMTVATLSMHIRRDLEANAKETCDDLSSIPYKLHDFGSRGSTSAESAAKGGAAHLVNFRSTDTMLGIDLLQSFYDGRPGQIGQSVPALEHSIITAYGQDREENAFVDFLAQYAKPGSTIAAVTDTYDLWHCLNVIWGQHLREKVIASGAVVGLRPDSGHPVQTAIVALQMLDGKFGHTINSKGFKVINHVKLVYGDGMNRESINGICDTMRRDGFSLDCIGAFGCGGGLLQNVNRDTLGCAYKLCEVDGVAVGKRPVTDLKKASKFGYHDLVNRDGVWSSVPGRQEDSALETVFIDGEITKMRTIKEIRERAWGVDEHESQ